MTETRTYVGHTDTQVFEGLKGLCLDQRYTDVGRDNGTMLVAAVGVLEGSGMRLSSEEWTKWSRK